jgi:hypothetical protein
LLDGSRHSFEVAWIKNSYLKMWVDDFLTVNFTGLSGASLSATPAMACVGIHHYDGAGGDPGFTFEYQFAQLSSVAANALKDPVSAPIIPLVPVAHQKLKTAPDYLIPAMRQAQPVLVGGKGH